MIRILITLCLCSFISTAQNTIPNLDFESWVLSASTRYEDPTPSSIWATPNYAMDLILGNPSTSIVQKSSDAHSGNYAALMKSRNIVGNFAGATLFTGYLNTASPFNPIPMLGVPFTGRPFALKGWYKYAPVGGDSSSIYIKLTKWNFTTNTQEVVGFAEKRDYSAVAAYSPFNLVVNYFTNDTPDSITLVFSASAGAEFGVGQVGSSLWIDDVVLDYGANSISENMISSTVQFYPNPFSKNLQIKTTIPQYTLSLYSMFGQLLLSTTQHYLDTECLPKGFYIIQARDNKQNLIANQIINKE